MSGAPRGPEQTGHRRTTKIRTTVAALAFTARGRSADDVPRVSTEECVAGRAPRPAVSAEMREILSGGQRNGRQWSASVLITADAAYSE
jgi:hypothetical protein